MEARTLEFEDPQASRIRRLLIGFGYALATLHLVFSILVLSAWGYPILGISRGSILPGASALLIVAAVLLFVGTWGLRTRKPWARAILLAYAVMWVGGTAVLHTTNFIAMESFYAARSNVRETPTQRLSTAAAQFEPLIYESVFPVILVVCLRIPGVAGSASDARHGFAPVLASDEARQLRIHTDSE
jgi:hypothetical protein